MSFLRSLALQNGCSRIHPAQSGGGSKESFLRSVSANGGIDDYSVEIGKRIVSETCGLFFQQFLPICKPYRFNCTL